MTRHAFRLSAARIDTKPLRGAGGLAVASLAVGFFCLCVAALSA